MDESNSRGTRQRLALPSTRLPGAATVPMLLIPQRRHQASFRGHRPEDSDATDSAPTDAPQWIGAVPLRPDRSAAATGCFGRALMRDDRTLPPQHLPIIHLVFTPSASVIQRKLDHFPR
jgi:hypothetical protein